MTSDGIAAALGDVLRDTRADAAVVCKRTDGNGFVLQSEPPELIAPESPWPGLRLPDEPCLQRDPAVLNAFVPIALRLQLPQPLQAMLTVRLGDDLALVLLWWSRDGADDGAVAAMASIGRGLGTTAADLDQRRMLAAANARLNAALEALDQAVITVDDRRQTASLNTAACRLLGLPAGDVSTAQLAEALRLLQSRALNRDEVGAVGTALLADTHGSTMQSVWHFAGRPSSLRIYTAPIRQEQLTGRVWVFDDISAEMEALAETERQRAALADSEARERLLLENSADVVSRGSNEGIPEWLSPSVTVLLGFKPEELVGKPFVELIHPDDRATVRATESQLRGGVSQALELRMRRKDGTYRWVSIRINPIFDEQGTVVGRAGAWRDIQAEVEARQEIQRGRARLQAAFDVMLDPHAVLQAVRDGGGKVVDFTYVDVNRATCEYHSLAPEQLLGSRLTEHSPGLAESGLLDIYVRAAQSDEPTILDDVLYHNEILGLTRWYDIRAARLNDGLSLTWRDVTARHEAAAAIRQRMAELDTLQKLSALLVQRVDLAPAVASACRLLEGLFDARSVAVRLRPQPDEQEGTADTGVATLDAPFTEAVCAALKSGQRTITSVADDGSPMLAVPLMALGETIGGLFVVRDSSAAEFSADERALAATAGELLAAVIHLEQLHEDETAQVASGERRRLARDLHDAVTQSIFSASMIANGLRDVWTRDPEQGAKDLELIQRLIRSAFAELRILLYELRPETLAMAPIEMLLGRLGDALAGQGEMEVEVVIEQDLVLPPGPRLVFYRVAQEALNNVGKYASAQHVEVTLAGDDGALVLTVRDDGRGFDRAAVRPGSMGQTIMQERAESIGAEVAVDSAPGAGTTVTLRWRPASGA